MLNVLLRKDFEQMWLPQVQRYPHSIKQFRLILMKLKSHHSKVAELGIGHVFVLLYVAKAWLSTGILSALLYLELP